MKRALLGLVLLSLPAAVAAHPGHVHEGSPGWTLDLSVTLPLAIALALYAIGWLRLHARSRRGQARLQREGLLFLTGWVVLSGALVSPLHEAGERSFTAHMIEHELIMLVATLFLAVSRAGPVLLWGLPAPARPAVARLNRALGLEAAWRALTTPIVATVLQAAALWLWHAPALFDRALASEGWHVAQHLSFFLTSLFFWRAMADAEARSRAGVAATCLFVTATVGAALGALMALSSSPWYAGYAAMGMTPYGLTPEQDQQLAGLIMWIPGGVVHLGAALAVLYRWLKPEEAPHAVAA